MFWIPVSLFINWLDERYDLGFMDEILGSSDKERKVILLIMDLSELTSQIHIKDYLIYNLVLNFLPNNPSDLSDFMVFCTNHGSFRTKSLLQRSIHTIKVGSRLGRTHWYLLQLFCKVFVLGTSMHGIKSLIWSERTVT